MKLKISFGEYVREQNMCKFCEQGFPEFLMKPNFHVTWLDL